MKIAQVKRNVPNIIKNILNLSPSFKVKNTYVYVNLKKFIFSTTPAAQIKGGIKEIVYIKDRKR